MLPSTKIRSFITIVDSSVGETTVPDRGKRASLKEVTAGGSRKRKRVKTVAKKDSAAGEGASCPLPKIPVKGPSSSVPPAGHLPAKPVKDNSVVVDEEHARQSEQASYDWETQFAEGLKQTTVGVKNK